MTINEPTTDTIFDWMSRGMEGQQIPLKDFKKIRNLQNAIFLNHKRYTLHLNSVSSAFVCRKSNVNILTREQNKKSIRFFCPQALMR